MHRDLELKFNLKPKEMEKELEERIERKKRMLSQFVELSEKLGMNEEARQKRIDIMLDDLLKLMKQRN